MDRWKVPGYTELRELGAGAQGRVVLARDDATGDVVAIKYLAPQLLGDAYHRAQFRAEAATLGRVIDPNVARLYGFVEAWGGAAIVMEAVDGVSLLDVLAWNGALGPEAALVVLKGSLLGLAAAHAVGVVHRDYKPQNVIVQDDGQSKLIDFGIAVLFGQSSSSGTPAYMAPEQWQGAPASPATDVYAATCVFFECVTGRIPFGGVDTHAVMVQHVSAAVPDERVPEPLRGLVAKGLAKDPMQRPSGAGEFVAELEAVASAYGRDWERRGLVALGAVAAVFAVVFPLAVLGGTPVGGLLRGVTRRIGDSLRMLHRIGRSKLVVAVAALAVTGAVTTWVVWPAAPESTVAYHVDVRWPWNAHFDQPRM